MRAREPSRNSTLGQPVHRSQAGLGSGVGWVTPQDLASGDVTYFQMVIVGREGQQWIAARGDATLRDAVGLHAPVIRTVPAGTIVEQRGLEQTTLSKDEDGVEILLQGIPVSMSGGHEGWVTPDATAASEGYIFFQPFSPGETGHLWRAVRDGATMQSDLQLDAPSAPSLS